MSRRLPPLTALRAFEAAARHLSFTRAAAELHVTQAAVSHQVRGLEEQLGVKLFRRTSRHLLLTDAGQACLPKLSAGFDLIEAAMREVHRSSGVGAVTVSVLPSFAASWLVPRIGRFRQAWPDIDLRIDASEGLADFRRGDVDVAIRYGRGSYPGLRADRLMAEDVYPVCSPRLRTGPRPLRTPADLAHHTLLHGDGPIDWRTWLRAAGVHGIDTDRGLTYVNSAMLIQAAVAGQGVALARSVLAADGLASGQLVRPFALRLPSDYAYYFVCPLDTAELPRIAALREWLLAEARGTEAWRADGEPVAPVSTG
ncbi:MAG: transcriptional regulator GcvA [Ectothiorhodospiraceae bacterium]|nr:transcriptional regulator GcvA [Chromatiales bacterium]MCP5155506.1 transcriptional regulator GcvA [Ectothiorhodospiraceae bacterium]